MTKIAKAFQKGKAFIPFITCGDPSLEVTEQLVYAMEKAGADLIELGIPFSDPTAEGPGFKRRGDHRPDLSDSSPHTGENSDSDGIYDLCKRRFFLRSRAFY